MKLRAMGVAMQQIEEFLEGAQGIEFRAKGRAERYALFETLLERHRCSRLGRARKGLLRRFLSKVSGLSRAQTTRWIGQYRRERRVRPQDYRRRRFPTFYTRAGKTPRQAAEIAGNAARGTFRWQGLGLMTLYSQDLRDRFAISRIANSCSKLAHSYRKTPLGAGGLFPFKGLQ